MNTQDLNKRKLELFVAQETILNAAVEAKRKLSQAEEETITNHTSEITSIDTTLARMAAIEKGKIEINSATSRILIPGTVADVDTKKVSAAYSKAFWNAISTRNFTNAALGEGGTAADGSYLVPAQTDPQIQNLALVECSARQLSRVIPTEMNVVLPYQASRAVAALKAESTNSGNNAFATNVPTFANTTLGAYMIGDAVTVSWELLQDVKALESFVSAELNRMIVTLEESNFVVGGTSGATSPLGYLEGGTAYATAALSLSEILSLTGSLKQAYYGNAKFLMNRSTFVALYQKQIAASQFMNIITWDPKGQSSIAGFPVVFSAEMPVYVASPEVNGAIVFGDFAAGWTIGDRGGNGIRVTVDNISQAANGQTVIRGYRRSDQRNTVAESTQILTING